MRLRLTHPLGTQDFELDSRTADDPIVIGRANDADVKVPSVSVSRAHAAIFVHDGNWIVQDSGSRDGTFVNGKKIEGPVRLALNDEVALGPGKAAVVQIVSLDLPTPVAVPPTTLAMVSAPLSAAPVDADTGATDEDESVAFDASTTAPYVPRRPVKRSNAQVVIVAIAGTVIVFSIGLAIFGYVRYQRQLADAEAKRKEQAAAPTTVEVIRRPATPAKGMFAEATNPRAVVQPTPPTPTPQPPAQPSTAQQATTPQTNVQPTPVSPAANDADPVEPARPKGPADRWRDAPEWQNLLDARDASPLPVAVLIYMDYKQQFKDSPLVKEADGFIAEAMDQLWWQRVTQLLSDAKKMEDEIAELKKERAEADEKDRKAQLDRQIRDVQDRLATNKLVRDDMKVTLTAPPNPDDEAAMAALRKARDPAAFETWSSRVMTRIRTTRGAAPW